MNTERESGGNVRDSAAVLGAAVSLWQACQRCASDGSRADLSRCYGDGIEWMREVMRVARLFETWSATHVSFDDFDECWPYFLEDRFGGACAGIVGAAGLASFDECDCLRVALRLRIPVICRDDLIVPIEITVPNPTIESGFEAFRIRTVRCLSVEDGVVPLTHDDDPFETEFGPPFFAFYGVESDGRLEHIADRRTYGEARELAQKLVPNLAFPKLAVTGCSAS